METRCVIFDIGGVLETTPATGWDVKWERRLGLSPGSMHRRPGDVREVGSLGKMTEPEVRARVAAVLGYVRGLRTRCRLGILSNSFVGAREREQELYGFGDLVEDVRDIVYSHETGIAKPAPEAFAVACERLRVRPADCLFVDDALVNVLAAEAAGMRGLLFAGNTATVAGIEEHLARR
ncbi:HAD-IA family hydrolase [Streptomyces sp. NPDC059849]|uniref:HAD-IA family hydrolase n=1 Tax=Streptomyces sp. NPDC059849 TaxID=3346969 RepID=UPI0036520091